MEHTKPYWSAEDVCEAMSFIEERLDRIDKCREVSVPLRKGLGPVLEAIHQLADSFDREGLAKFQKLYHEGKAMLANLTSQEEVARVEMEEMAASVSHVMNANDYRFLLAHRRAEEIISLLPMYPTGSLYVVNHFMSPETLVFHATTYWDHTGCRYVFDDARNGEEILVRVAGTAKALLKWLLAEYEQNDSIIGEFEKCEDEDLINAYIRQHKLTSGIEQGEENE